MKRCFSLFLSLMVALSLCACGQKEAAPSWQDQYDLGIRYLFEGNYEEAIIAFTAAIEIDPKNTAALSSRGQAYVLSGESEENLAAAQADFEAALAVDAKFVDAWLGLADVYIRTGEYDRAIEVLKDAMEKTNGAQSIASKLDELERGIFLDSTNNMRRRVGYDQDGSLSWYHTYTYDERNRLATAISFDALDRQTGHVDYAYDEVGNCVVDIGFGSHDGVRKMNLMMQDTVSNQRGTNFPITSPLPS